MSEIQAKSPIDIQIKETMRLLFFFNTKDNISFVYNLKKIGYSKCTEKYLVKAFQMRFRPELINGKIDKECLEISKSIVKA